MSWEPTPQAVRRLRAELGVSAAAAARRINVVPRTWRNWEAGKSRPQGSTRRALEDLAEEVYGEPTLEQRVEELEQRVEELEGCHE